MRERLNPGWLVRVEKWENRHLAVLESINIQDYKLM